MSESELEKKVGTFCRLLGLEYYKFSSPARRGVPDRMILGPNGRILFMELKAKGKKPTKLQLRELAILTAMGFRAEWTDNYTDATSIIHQHFDL